MFSIIYYINKYNSIFNNNNKLCIICRKLSETMIMIMISYVENFVEKYSIKSSVL